MTTFEILTLPNFQYFPYKHLPFEFSADVKCLPGPLTHSLSNEGLKHWKTWLGTLRWDDIEDSKAYLIGTSESNKTALYDAYLAMMICAPLRPIKGQAILMSGTGTFENEKLNAKQIHAVSPYPAWVESHYMRGKVYHRTGAAKLKAPTLLNEFKTISKS